MDLENSFEFHEDDAPLDHSISEVSDLRHEPTDMRVQRADDYERLGLSRPDPLEACLASINAGLIRIADRIESSIENSFAANGVTTDTLPGLESTLNNYLRLVRQIERFAQFEMRAAESRKRAANSAAKQQLTGLPQLQSNPMRRNRGLIPTNW